MSLLYQKVNTDEVVFNKKSTAESILKQSLICSVVAVQYFLTGLCFGATTVLIPQIRKETNSTNSIDDEIASWIYSTSTFAAYPWIFILPIATNYWGRKLPQLATSVCCVAIFAILYFSQNVYHIIVSQTLVGFVLGGNITTRILTVVDYTSPKYRGMFLAIKSASFYWGLWVANAVGTFYPWKYIAVLGFVCSIYTFNVLFWPESPYWLAKKGRFEECRASYQWIHGRDAQSEKEIREILQAEVQTSDTDISFSKMFKCKEFYKPILLCIMIILQYQFSGKLVCGLYVLDIFKNITEGETAAYSAMLILDGVTVFGMYFGSYLSKILNRRTLYFSSSFTVIFLLFTVSLYLYLVKFTILESSNIVTIVLLTLYSLTISCGPPILALSIYGELIPSKFQASCYVISGLTHVISSSWLIKLSPLTFAYFGIHGTFLFFGVTCGLCTTYLYFYMPETKNKTCQEIERFFQDKNKIIEECEPLQ